MGDPESPCPGFMVYILVILVLAVIVLLVTCGPVLLLMRSGKRAKVAGENQEVPPRGVNTRPPN
eukprot:5305233-Amphidinium_carterae.1